MMSMMKKTERNKGKLQLDSLLEVVLLDGGRYHTIALYDLNKPLDKALFIKDLEMIVRMMEKNVLDQFDQFDQYIFVKENLYIILHDVHQFWSYEEFVKIQGLEGV